MNCFNHPEITSVGVCQDCQKGLCNQCASKYSIPICSQCNANRKKSEKSEIYKELVLTFGIGIAGTYFFILNFGSSNLEIDIYQQITFSIMMSFMFSSIIAGWYTLSSLTSNYFMFLPIIGWFIYFIIKFWLSSLIGLIMLPIRTFKNIRRLKQLKQIQK